MKNRSCIHEIGAARLARAGHGTDALEHHVAGCEVCAEVVRVSRAVVSLSAPPVSPAALPDPALILLKARLIAQRTAEENLWRGFAIHDLALQALPWSAAGGWLIWNGSAVTAYVDGVLSKPALTDSLAEAMSFVARGSSLDPAATSVMLTAVAVFVALAALKPLSVES